jgi:hypothetical protein
MGVCFFIYANGWTLLPAATDLTPGPSPAGAGSQSQRQTQMQMFPSATMFAQRPLSHGEGEVQREAYGYVAT